MESAWAYHGLLAVAHTYLCAQAKRQPQKRMTVLFVVRSYDGSEEGITENLRTMAVEKSGMIRE